MEDLANCFQFTGLMWLVGVHSDSLKSTTLITIAVLFAASFSQMKIQVLTISDEDSSAALFCHIGVGVNFLIG